MYEHVYTSMYVCACIYVHICTSILIGTLLISNCSGSICIAVKLFFFEITIAIGPTTHNSHAGPWYYQDSHSHKHQSNPASNIMYSHTICSHSSHHLSHQCMSDGCHLVLLNQMSITGTNTTYPPLNTAETWETSTAKYMCYSYLIQHGNHDHEHQL